MSGTTLVEMAKARRSTMPLEYVRTGMSRYSPRPENSAISPRRASTSFWLRPSRRPRMLMFS
jgi:hypothetical protein